MKQKKMFRACAAAALVCMAVIPVSVENELCAVTIDGGSL